MIKTIKLKIATLTMNYTLKRVIITFILIFSLSSQVFAIEDEFTLFHPTYFNEQNSIFETIHYLENEMLSFEVCPKQEVEITSKIICSSNEEIELELFEKSKGSSSCYYANKNFDEISCNDFTLYTSYTQNEKERIITREFEQERESKLLNYILEKEYISLTSLDLSYYLLTLNMIQDQTTQETVNAYEKLKNDRDNTNKCWPKNNCDLLTTAKILNNIKIAQYDDDSRLLEDGSIYLENKILADDEVSFTSQTNSQEIYEVEIKINHEFSSGEEIDCDLDLDFGDEEKSYSFDDDSDLEELRIYKNAEENIDFSCDEDVDEIIITTFEESIAQDYTTTDDRISVDIPDNDRDDFSEFNLEIEIFHEFAIGEEIECTLDLDDGTQTDYTFDEDSDKEDFIIAEVLDESFEFECDDDVDELFYVIYGGNFEVETQSNSDTFEYELDSNEDDTFNFDLIVKYDFKNDDDEIQCEIKTDEKTRTQTFDEDDENDGVITISKYSSSNSISISCDRKIEELTYKLYDKFGREQIEEITEDITTKSYTIPNEFSKYSCISTSNNCDFETTLLANSLIDSSFDEKTEVENFLKSFTREDSNDLLFIDNNDKKIELSGKFLYFFDNDEIQDSLKFIQNNDGSWGTKSLSEKIIETSWASIGLIEQEKENEYLDDARKWVYFNEPTIGWGSIEKNTLAYLTIEEQIKPYLKVSTINSIESNIILTIENPTIFSIKNIEIDFGTNLNDKLSFRQTIEELGQNEKEEINISLLGGFSGTESGELIITGFNNKKEIELINIPISISAPFPFKFTSEDVKIIEGDIYTKISVNSDLEIFSTTCSIQNPFEKRVEQVVVDQDTKEIQLSNILQQQGKFSVEINCNSEEGKTFSKTETINVEVIPKTFTVNSPDVNLYEIKEDFSISITNDADEPQTINFEIDGDYSDIIIITETSKILAKNETRDIYFSLNNSDILQSLGESSTGTLTITSGEYKKNIPLYYTQPIKEEFSIPWLWVIIGVIIIIISIFVIKRYSQLNSDQENSEEFQGEDDDLFLDEDIEFK
jgi:hypothetical protein